jgi:hypothetical protein
MMKKITLPFSVLGSVVVGLALFTHCTSKTETTDKPKTDYVSNDDPAPLCLVQPSWFPHSQTPAPAEGTGSPFDAPTSTNQIFHQWSWNKFLWLTKPDAGGNPLFLNQSTVRQVTTLMAPVTVPAGVLVVLQDINQAGSQSPVLQTNPDYNSDNASETVYYSIHMNEQMYQAGLKFGIQFAGGQLPPTNQTAFPVSCFELKVAWVPVTAIPAAKRAQYYTAMSSLSADGGKTYNNTEVALIGMHVVGVVQNHPEFIWATFEHEDLSPDYDWTANSATAAADQLLFKKGSVSGINGILFNTATKLGIMPYQVFDLFQYGVPRNNGGAFMTTSQAEPENFDNIDNINQCVQNKLEDVWKNYFYNGSIWLNMDGKTPLQQAQLINSLGKKIGSATPGSSARGSLNCANVTMESFTQTFKSQIQDINVNTLANCFSCHTGTSFADPTQVSPLYLSHTFQDYILRKEGNSPAKVEKLKTQDEVRTLQRLR